MSFDEIYARLRELGSEQTRNTYLRHGFGDNTFGVSFADLSTLKKQLVGRGKDRTHAHRVAEQLWASGTFEARTLATLVADPAQLTPAQAQSWAPDLSNHSLADALAALVAGTDFAWTKAEEWMTAPGEYQQRLGYAVLARLAVQDNALPDEAFELYVARMELALQQAPNRAKEGMNNALIAIGSRSEALRRRVEAAADRIGPISIDHGATACQTFELRPYLAKVWARKALKS
ncbi:DNA alkylation repair protein [Hymenobacter coalescens]